MAKIPKKLLKALESDERCEAENIIKAKKQEDFEALQSLLALDNSIIPGHRAKAIFMLGRWGDPAPITAIREILPYLDETERITAIDALGWLGGKEALADIVKYADDSSPQVRKFVAHALHRINTSEARAKLKEISEKDPEEFVRTITKELLKKRRKSR